jgi:hypothetical protein
MGLTGRGRSAVREDVSACLTDVNPGITDGLRFGIFECVDVLGACDPSIVAALGIFLVRGDCDDGADARAANRDFVMWLYLPVFGACFGDALNLRAFRKKLPNGLYTGRGATRQLYTLPATAWYSLPYGTDMLASPLYVTADAAETNLWLLVVWQVPAAYRLYPLPASTPLTRALVDTATYCGQLDERVLPMRYGATCFERLALWMERTYRTHFCARIVHSLFNAVIAVEPRLASVPNNWQYHGRMGFNMFETGDTLEVCLMHKRMLSLPTRVYYNAAMHLLVPRECDAFAESSFVRAVFAVCGSSR